MSKEVSPDAEQESSLLSLQNEVLVSLSQCNPPPPPPPRLACWVCTLPSSMQQHRTAPCTRAQVRLLQNRTPTPNPDPNPNQVRLLQNIRHEHIVAFVAALSLPGGHFCYLQEFARGGTLDAAIRARRTLATPFASTVVARWMRQLATVTLAGGSTHRPPAQATATARQHESEPVRVLVTAAMAAMAA